MQPLPSRSPSALPAVAPAPAPEEPKGPDPRDGRFAALVAQAAQPPATPPPPPKDKEGPPAAEAAAPEASSSTSSAPRPASKAEDKGPTAPEDGEANKADKTPAPTAAPTPGSAAPSKPEPTLAPTLPVAAVPTAVPALVAAPSTPSQPTAHGPAPAAVPAAPPATSAPSQRLGSARPKDPAEPAPKAISDGVPAEAKAPSAAVPTNTKAPKIALPEAIISAPAPTRAQAQAAPAPAPAQSQESTAPPSLPPASPPASKALTIPALPSAPAPMAESTPAKAPPFAPATPSPARMGEAGQDVRPATKVEAPPRPREIAPNETEAAKPSAHVDAVKEVAPVHAAGLETEAPKAAPKANPAGFATPVASGPATTTSLGKADLPSLPAPPNATTPQLEAGVKWMLRTGAQEAQLQLHPENLGQVSIHLKVEGGEVHARLWVSEATSVQALQEGRAHLEQSLRQQGLQLGSFDLQQGRQPSQRGFEAPAPSSAPSSTDPVPGVEPSTVASAPRPSSSRRLELIA